MVALIHRLVVAGRAAGFTVQQAVGAEANVDLRLTQHAVFLARAVLFRLLALRTADFAGGGFRRHAFSLEPAAEAENVTEVMKVRSEKSN